MGVATLPHTMAFDYAARIERARHLMGGREVEVLLLSVGADLPYLTGYEATPLERLTMLVLPVEGTPVLVVPELEASRVEPRPEAFGMRPWRETEDPVAMVADLVGQPRRAAIGDRTWAVFLLRLREVLGDTEFVPADPLTRELRMRKEPLELELLRAAGAAVDRVVERLGDTRFSGRTERDLAAEIAGMTVEEGHEVATSTIVASGPNGASPHHEPTDRVVEGGDAVVVDFGGRLGGYCSDTTRTFVVGEPADPEFLEAYGVLKQAHAAGVEAVAPGVPAQQIDRVARELIEQAGYGECFIHRTGHGIGLEVHEHPYLVEGNDLLLEPGMTFSVEPGIYLPGRFGTRIEDIVAVTTDGVERLNRTERDPIPVS